MDRAPATKAYKGVGMEGFTARWYASVTRKSLDEFKALARRVAGQITPGARVLELAPGPGYFVIELAKLGSYRITGLDVSRTFVEIARKNAEEAEVDAEFRRGDAAHMPFEDGSFDFLLCRAAFKNFAEPVTALREMHRVLKPGGTALIIDLRRDASKESIGQEVDGMRLGAVNTLITKLTFRFMLLRRAYTKQEFEPMVSQTGFGAADVRQNPIGLEIHLHKR
jgi:ubiquinone/menaquinone biosynthesis C-methylase UbiE